MHVYTNCVYPCTQCNQPTKILIIVSSRFLNGELFLDCVRTNGMYDVWSQLEYTGGETFSAIETNPVKRVCLLDISDSSFVMALCCLD